MYDFISVWKDFRRRWIWIGLSDAGLALFEVIQGIVWLKNGRVLFAISVFFLSGLMSYMAIKAFLVSREAKERVIEYEGLEERRRKKQDGETV